MSDAAVRFRTAYEGRLAADERRRAEQERRAREARATRVAARRAEQARLRELDEAKRRERLKCARELAEIARAGARWLAPEERRALVALFERLRERGGRL